MANREQSEVLIQDIFEWPLFPFLPMKRIGSYFRPPGSEIFWVGFLFADDVRENRWLVYRGPITNDIWKEKKPPTAAVLQDYESLKALLDDGWVVD